jgi:hypothetical protein
LKIGKKYSRDWQTLIMAVAASKGKFDAISSREETHHRERRRRNANVGQETQHRFRPASSTQGKNAFLYDIRAQLMLSAYGEFEERQSTDAV